MNFSKAFSKDMTFCYIQKKEKFIICYTVKYLITNSGNKYNIQGRIEQAFKKQKIM